MRFGCSHAIAWHGRHKSDVTLNNRAIYTGENKTRLI